MPTAIRDYGQQTASLLAYLIFKGVDGNLSVELQHKVGRCIDSIQNSSDRMTDLCVELRKQLKSQETPGTLAKLEKFINNDLLVSGQVGKIIMGAIDCTSQKEGIQNQ